MHATAFSEARINNEFMHDNKNTQTFAAQVNVNQK